MLPIDTDELASFVSVCLSVCLCFCLFVTLMSPGKTA